MASTESDVRALLDRRSEAMGMKDIDRLMACYTPDVVYFDAVPPLHYVGADALRGRFLHWFEGWDGPIGQEIHDLRILAGGDVAATSMLIRATGTVKGGPDVTRWVRTTSNCRRSDGTWLIAHEHVSFPVDVASGSAALDLEP